MSDAGPWRGVLDQLIALGRAPIPRRKRAASIDGAGSDQGPDAKRPRHSQSVDEDEAMVRCSDSDDDLVRQLHDHSRDAAQPPRAGSSSSPASAQQLPVRPPSRGNNDARPAQAPDPAIEARLDRLEAQLAAEQARRGEIVGAFEGLLSALSYVLED